MDLSKVKLQLLTTTQIQGVAGAFAEELIDKYVTAFTSQVAHLKTEEEFESMAPSQAMYTSLVHLVAKAIFGEVLTRHDFTKEPPNLIVDENMRMLVKDVTSHLESIAKHMMLAQSFDKDDTDNGSSN